MNCEVNRNFSNFWLLSTLKVQLPPISASPHYTAYCPGTEFAWVARLCCISLNLCINTCMHTYPFIYFLNCLCWSKTGQPQMGTLEVPLNIAYISVDCRVEPHNDKENMQTPQSQWQMFVKARDTLQVTSIEELNWLPLNFKKNGATLVYRWSAVL